MENLKTLGPSQNPCFQWRGLGIHVILFLSGLAAVFFLLTNGVPLIQAGWMGELGKKTRYVRLMVISVLIFSVLMFLIRLKWPQLFERLWWVKVWNLLCRIPLGHVATILFVLYAGLMAAVGFERHLALETRAFDLGIFAQAVWNTLQGDLFFSSIKENINLLGDHVSPILILATPFYAIWPDPRMLILLQAIAAASAFFPLALIARDKLKGRPFVMVFLLMYFFYQPMRAALHEDFHPEVLAEPFLWWAFLFLDRGRVIRFLACLALAVTGKENFLGIAFMLGFYAFVWKRMRVLGILVMLGAAGLFIWETKWLVPHLTGAKYFYGGNYLQAISDPVNGIVKRLISGESIGYAFKVYVPFLFLPFAHLPTLVLTFPVFFQNLLSVNGSMRSFNYHYLTGFTPFAFISTIIALHALSETRDWWKRNLGTLSFILLIVSVIRSGPSEYWFFWNIHSHRSAHTDMIRQELQKIPQQARVLTHNAFIPQLCNRKFVYQFNYNADPTKLDFAKKYAADTVIWDSKFWEPNTDSLSATLSNFTSAGHRIEKEKNGFFILASNETI